MTEDSAVVGRLQAKKKPLYGGRSGVQRSALLAEFNFYETLA